MHGGMDECKTKIHGYFCYEYEMSSVTIDHVVKENGGNFVYCSDGL
jgi:hypothetical protein